MKSALTVPGSRCSDVREATDVRADGISVAVSGRSADTGLVLVKDIEEVRAALREGRSGDLLGLAECGWLDAKAGVYQLDDPAKILELAKDAAAFANTGTGGMILVGYATRKENDGEILDQIRPVPRALVDLDRYRKLIREWVVPAPRGFSVDFFDTDAGSGILAIDVPVQPSALLPFVVPGGIVSGGPNRLAAAVPVREADATVWLSQAEIQRRLAAGWTATGQPDVEATEDGRLRAAFMAELYDEEPEGLWTWMAPRPIGLRIGIEGFELRVLVDHLEQAGYLEVDYEENVRLTDAGRRAVSKSRTS